MQQNPTRHWQWKISYNGWPIKLYKQYNRIKTLCTSSKPGSTYYINNDKILKLHLVRSSYSLDKPTFLVGKGKVLHTRVKVGIHYILELVFITILILGELNSYIYTKSYKFECHKYHSSDLVTIRANKPIPRYFYNKPYFLNHFFVLSVLNIERLYKLLCSLDKNYY